MVLNRIEHNQETVRRPPKKPAEPIEDHAANPASAKLHHHQDGELEPPIQFEGSPLLPPRNSTETARLRKDCMLFLTYLISVFSPVAWLENKSSVARDHLANERTFLAWFRTSLSLTSIGIALVQISRLAKQIQVAQVKKIIVSVHPIIEPLSHSSVYNAALHDLTNLANQSSSIQSTLIQINQNLINLQSTIDQIQRNVDTIGPTKSLASLLGNCYVCIGLLFLFIGTYRYFRVQQVLQTGQFPHSRRSIGVSTLVVSALLVVTAVGMLKSGF